MGEIKLILRSKLSYNCDTRLSYPFFSGTFYVWSDFLKDNTNHVILKTLPGSAERLPLFIVGDVHGCARELSELIKLAKTKVPQFQLIMVGDLFTKGPDPIGIYEQIMEHNAICIKGNHDWALKALISKSRKPSQKSHISQHSKQTLNLIRYHKNLIADFIIKLPYAISTTITPNPSHANWEKSYPMIILHAGMDPLRGLHKTTERMLLTARFVHFEMHRGEKILMPISQWDIARGEKINTIHRWHEFHHGPELIVFGHDAKQGLFRKTLANGRPICVGLDTGCTYGKFLTGYFPESDSAIQVKAHRVYFDVKENVIIQKTSGNHE